MTGKLYLSRARLRADMDRLGPILFPGDPSQNMSNSHRLVWALFPKDMKERPFLYRESERREDASRHRRKEYMILSSVEPSDSSGLFHVETKPFEPALVAGDRLAFVLRANATVQSRDRNEQTSGARSKTRRYDVVMNALNNLPKEHRGAERPRVIREAGLEWLTKQGLGGGFTLPEPEKVAVDGYQKIAIDPNRLKASPGKGRAGHSRLEFEGELEVSDPQAFLARLATGFGRARAFGHGLMLIRRAG